MTISAGDPHSGASGVVMPRLPWSLDDYTARGDIRGYRSRRFRTSLHTHSDIFNMANLEAGRLLHLDTDRTSVTPAVRTILEQTK